MNTAHVILRTLIVTWSVLFVVMGTLLALYLIERWLDCHDDDWELWEDDLEPDPLFEIVDLGGSYTIPIPDEGIVIPYDWETRVEDGL